MVTLFITAFAILVLIGIGIYFWQKPAADYSESVLPPSPNARGLFADDASSIAEEALQKVRSMSYLLHPPLLEESGLLPALHWYFEGLQSRGQVRLVFDYRPILFPRLPRDIETAIFRVIQESLTNVYRHSESQDRLRHRS